MGTYTQRSTAIFIVFEVICVMLGKTKNETRNLQVVKRFVMIACETMKL